MLNWNTLTACNSYYELNINYIPVNYWIFSKQIENHIQFNQIMSSFWDGHSLNKIYEEIRKNCSRNLIPLCFTTDLEAIVGPTAKFHLTALIVKRKPGYIDFARRLEDSRWDIHARTIVTYHYVSWIRPIKSLVGAVIKYLINIQSEYPVLHCIRGASRLVD